MKTVIYGTLEEWMAFKPDALLINKKSQHKYTDNGAAIQFPMKYETPQKTTYHSRVKPCHYTDWAPPYFFIGPRCPYIVKGESKYFVSITTIHGGGCVYPIEEWLWNDPNWEEIERLEDCFRTGE